MIVFGWVEICSKMQKKFGQHIILLIYSSILESKFPAPYLNFWAWQCLFDLVGVALKTMEISSQTQQLHCTVVQKWIDYSAISDISSNGIQSPKIIGQNIFQEYNRNALNSTKRNVYKMIFFLLTFSPNNWYLMNLTLLQSWGGDGAPNNMPSLAVMLCVN